ncbi:MAG: dihydrolipoamide acetyltransferase family protein, partial [Acidimicrobiia bacterium]
MTGPVVEFRLPDVGEGLEEGEIVAWRVAEGDIVNRDQTLVDVQTDKSLVELPSPVAGRVVRLAAEAGEIVKVGQLLIVLETGAALGSAAIPTAEGAAMARRPKAAPAVRKLAVERNVDLAAVQGSGPGGRILATDVESAAGTATSTGAISAATATSGGTVDGTATLDAGAGTRAEANMAGFNHVRSGGAVATGRQPLRGIRRVTAETMTRSWSEIPHITAMDELDATALLDARRRLAEAAPDRERTPDSGTEFTLAVLFVAAVARALRRHPLMNSSLDMEAGEIVVHDSCHIGVAVATHAGLLVPVVR